MIIPTKNKDKKLYINTGLVVVVCLLLFGGVSYYVQDLVKAKTRLNCQYDFYLPNNNEDKRTPHQRAQDAYSSGARYLDRDHDGIACENLLPIHQDEQ